MIALPCPTCNGDGFVSTGDRHTETRQDVCPTCRGHRTIPASTGESPEASAPPPDPAVGTREAEAFADALLDGIRIIPGREFVVIENPAYEPDNGESPYIGRPTQDALAAVGKRLSGSAAALSPTPDKREPTDPIPQAAPGGEEHGQRLISPTLSPAQMERMAFNLCGEFGPEFVMANKAFALAVYAEAYASATRVVAPTASGAGFGRETDRRVPAQVWAAARSLDKAQRWQPEWLWHEAFKGVSSYGPQGLRRMAPYVRADIALGQVAPTSSASPRAGGLDREGIARIIEPISFRMTPADYRTDAEGFLKTFAWAQQQEALAKADAILAIAQTPASGGGGETFETIAQWCDATFGPVTPDRIASRANEEMVELLADPERVEEAADVVIVLSRYPGLWAAVERKMAVNRARKWRLMGDGTGYHVPAEGLAPTPQDTPEPDPVARAREGETQAVRDVLAERRRQVEAEGWTADHDDDHALSQLALAAACYALPAWHRHNIGVYPADGHQTLVQRLWPWSDTRLKPKGRRRDLVKAGALIQAEIERLDRAALRTLEPASTREDGR